MIRYGRSFDIFRSLARKFSSVAADVVPIETGNDAIFRTSETNPVSFLAKFVAYMIHFI